MSTEPLTDAIFTAIDEFNEDPPQGKELSKSLDTVLFGPGGALDSIGLVNLIVATEQAVERVFGVAITLADEKAMSQKQSPFRTVRALRDYVETLLNANAAP